MDAWSAFKSWLRERARERGFPLMGVTTPEMPATYTAYIAWLAQGFHAEMAWMAHERAKTARANPRLLLPECQSIVVLAATYWPSYALPKPTGDVRGRVASYAWGRDYHRVLKKRAKNLVWDAQVRLGRPIAHRIYVDTGPLLERDLGQRAGLGWMGKNTCLIHPRLGSFFFLAEILWDVPLPPDPPFSTEHCGTCTRCIDACPTQAILPGRVVDARRCISYLTIEHRGPLPEALRPLLGDWVFGCDICQNVCPWNRRFAPRTADPAFAPRREQAYPDLRVLMRMDEATFREAFQGTALMRAKREGLLRNAAVVLGNLRDPRGLPALVYGAHDPSPLVREHVAWALGHFGTSPSRRTLRNVRWDPDVRVRRAAARALLRIALMALEGHRVSVQ